MWIYDLKRSRVRTWIILGGNERGDNHNPVWSRDGNRIFFASNRGGDWDIYSQPADGSQSPEVLLKS
jgi:Tol biopolymer transport system component